jgi:hypothetical protein
MLRGGGYITPFQIHVTNTRLGHGRPKKTRKFSEKEIHGQRKAQEQSPRLGGIKVLKKKQFIIKT